MKKPVVLMILDGFGLSEETRGNAIAAARTPVIDGLMKEYPFVKGYASGLAVGLPDGQMGNSEVGHLNMGAGRVVYQDLTRITKSIEDGDFFEKEELLAAIENCKSHGSDLHLYGLMSDGGVHSDIRHLYALLKLCRQKELDRVYIHCFMDGRDTSPTSGIEYIRELIKETETIGVGQIASICGRYYAMDRDNRWERVEKAYRSLVFGEGIQEEDPILAMQHSYDREITDEFIEPVVIEKDGKPLSLIKAYDSIIFFNFRPDRAREISRAFCDPEFAGFERRNGFFNVNFVCMAQYDATMPNVSVAYPPEQLTMTMGEYLAKLGKTQLRIAETQKYAHVTFFFNGGEEKQFEGEDRILIKSPDVPTFDLKPEMSAYEVCDAVCKAIDEDKYDVIILNYANCDMVGHTGIFDAAVKAVEATDECVGRMVDAILAKGGAALITADHGNADKMMEPDGSPFTAHTTNPVPLIAVGVDAKLAEGGVLADLAPTMLDIMGVPQPAEMTGKSLLIK